MLAARDTTTLTLAWLFYELGRNPDIEQAIRKEMDEKLNVTKDTYLTPDHIRSLTMLEATIKETLRYHPVAPLFMREASEDTFICGDILVKKGQIVGLSMYSIYRNPKTWGPDAGEFKPQRWIDEKTGYDPQHSTDAVLQFQCRSSYLCRYEPCNAAAARGDGEFAAQVSFRHRSEQRRHLRHRSSVEPEVSAHGDCASYVRSVAVFPVMCNSKPPSCSHSANNSDM